MIFAELIETIRRDITGVKPDIVRWGQDAAEILRGEYSKNKQRQLGLRSDKWSKKARQRFMKKMQNRQPA